MNTFKKITLTSAVAFALFAFNACGDDSNSTSASGENSTQSSAVENDESSSSINDNSSSSSVIPSDSEGSSSSSSVKADGKSSSSINKEGSSSSTKVNVYSSSSDVVVEIGNSSSSYGSSSSVKEGSSSSVFDITAPCTNGSYKRYQGVVYECVNETWILYVAPSSSSVASSSSHEYKKSPDPLKMGMSYGEFVDRRDGTKYATIEITNKYGPDSVQISFTVFAQNLKYREKMTLAADEQNDDTKVEGYCYRDSTEYCDDWYGAYYQWAEMMALPYECNSKSCADLIDPDGDGFHQGICPDDWHVMTQKEMLAVFYVTGTGSYDAMKSFVSYEGGGHGSNKSGLSMVASGRRSYKTGNFEEYHKLAHFSYPAESTKKPENSALGGGFGADVNDIKSSTQYKLDGTQIRCVKDY